MYKYFIIAILVSFLSQNNFADSSDKKSAVQEDKNDKYYIALSYLHGKGVKKNINKGLELLKENGTNGDIDSQELLGHLYFLGRKTPKNFDESLKWYLKAAKQGSRTAQFGAGNIYYKKNDLVKATKWIKKSANQGFPDSIAVLGSMYLIGEGVKKNKQKAIELFLKSAKLDSFIGMIEYGNYLITDDNESNDTEGFNWLNKATKKDDASMRSFYLLGLAYFQGNGVKQNDSKAFELILKSADGGYAKAQYEIAGVYEDGLLGIDKDDEKAFKWYLKSATQGYVFAQNSLGIFYKNGRYVKKDIPTAIKWFEKSGLQGNSLAYNNLASIYLGSKELLGIEIDYKKVFGYYRKSADLGNSLAKYQIGNFFREGLKGKVDYISAKKWYEAAAKDGYSDAMNALGIIHNQGGYGIKTNVDKAIEWFKKGAEKNNTLSQRNLGDIYFMGGAGVKKDIKKAIKLYLKAANNNDKISMYNLGTIELKSGNRKEAIKWYEKAVKLGDSSSMIVLAPIKDKNVYLSPYASVVHIKSRASMPTSVGFDLMKEAKKEQKVSARYLKAFERPLYFSQMNN